MSNDENINPIVIPSRTIILTDVPLELNDEETLRTYFSQFGTLLWVNAKYEENEQVAVVTFFSISDAIAAFMCDSAVLDDDSIRKSWFKYTKECNQCSYKYTLPKSIEQHKARCHSSKVQAHLLEFGMNYVYAIRLAAFH